MRTLLVSVLLACAFAAPAGAFGYEVEGSRPLFVDVDDDLFYGGVVSASMFYALPLLVSTIRVGTADPTAKGNALTGLALSTPPLVGGLLVGNHYLDEMEATDAREGWAALPAMMMWGASLGQVVGLVLLGVAFIAAERVPIE